MADPTVPIPDGGAVSQDQFARLMAAIASSKTAVEEQMQGFKRELKESQERVTESVVKKVRRSKCPEFKRRGNEIQFSFNEQVAEKMETVDEELNKLGSVASSSAGATALDKAKEAVKEGTELLQKRQKLIKLADRSEYGWDLVKEYESDELAADSDDEKKILKAEKAAEKRLAKKKAVAASARGGSKNRYAVQKSDDWRSTGLRAGGAGPQQSWPTAFKSNFSPGVSNSSTMSNGLRRAGPCHNCGEFGHWKNACRNPKPGLSNTKYPFAGCVHNGTSTEDSSSNGAIALGLVSDELLHVSDELLLAPADELASRSERCWEVEDEIVVATPCVKGRLHNEIKYWEEVLKATSPVISILQQGYILPFLSVPDSKLFNNQRSALENAVFVSQSIVELLGHGCIKELVFPPNVCSPLVVVVSRAGKKRLVINLRYVNRFLSHTKFKYEDMRTALMFFEKDDFLCTFDLKSGYHHVDIHPSSQPFLGFQWDGRYYMFTVLPFGLSTACYIFTKLLRPLVAHWRSKGIRVVVYIDDGIVVAQGRDRARHCSQIIKDTLDAAGFVTNPAKCQWVPQCSGQWLGFSINLHEGSIAIPEGKVQCLKDQLLAARTKHCMSAKFLAGIVGRIISMGLGLGPIVRLRTRSLYALLESRSSWYDSLEINADAKAELEFWLSGIDVYNGQSIWRAPSAVRVVYSDASSTGYGGYVVEHGCCVAQGQWDVNECVKSSTWRELAAVARVLGSVAGRLANHRVRWFTDNQNVVRIITVGSRIEELQAQAMIIFKLALCHQISIEPEWIPREQNELADYISRIIDYDDWSINPAVFGMLDAYWGPHTVDRFAHDQNAQLERFNSKYWCPGTEAVDAFTVNWQGENNWWCPPIGLVPRVLQHASNCMCEGTLIIPHWRSAPFWPMLCSNGEQFVSFVKSVVRLEPAEHLFLPGLSGSLLFKGIINTDVLALRLQF